MDGGRRWLDQFPADWRGAIGNWFYGVARDSGAEISPSGGCSQVYCRLRAAAGDSRGGTVSRHAVLRAMEEDPEGAKAFMDWVLQQERRSPEERSRDKEAAVAAGRRDWMSRQTPTENQITYLRKLGYEGDIDNRMHASDLIEQYQKKEGSK